MFRNAFFLLLISYVLYLPGAEVNFASENTKIKFSGTATDLESGKLLYRDFHEEIWENGKHVRSLVLYKDPEGNIFAKKKISFAKNRTLPDIQLDDDRDGYLEGGTYQEGTSVKLYFRRMGADPIQEKIIDAGNLSALDGGFDYFVINHWDELVSGKKIKFALLVPVERDKFQFSLEKIKEGEYKGKPALFLRMKIDNAILSVFVKPIDLVYDIGSKRIMEFRGTSNINDEKGKSYKVKIVYGFR